MTNYIMRFDTNSIELAWEYTFTQYSDQMAMEYAARHAKVMKHDLAVFKQEIDGEYSFLGRIEVNVKVDTKINYEGNRP